AGTMPHTAITTSSPHGTRASAGHARAVRRTPHVQVSCRTGIGLARATVVLEPLLVLVRHGDVEHGHDVLWGRSPGVTLTAQGRRAIVALTPALRRLRVSRLVTSPCHRAVESAALLSDALGVHVDADAGFD